MTRLLSVSDKFNTTKYDKKKHKGFNVLYYFPSGGDQEFLKWLYGYDIFLKVRVCQNLNYAFVGCFD